MAVYHVNPETGRANQCHAFKRPCPLGDASQHFLTKEGARRAYETRMVDQNLLSVKKSIIPPAMAAAINGERAGELHAARVEDWKELQEVDAALAKNHEEVSILERKSRGLLAAKTAVGDALAVEAKGVTDSQSRGLINLYARRSLSELRKTEAWQPNQGDVWYPAPEYPDLSTVEAVISTRITDLNMQLQGLSDNTDFLEARQKELEEAVASTGYRENPKFGIPTGQTTKEKWAGKQAGNYSSLPTKDVPVLQNSEQFCINCGESVTIEKYGFAKHSNGEKPCNSTKAQENKGSGTHSTFVQVNPTCHYCGTGDPAYYSFKFQSYSDESSCSRCGGVSGRATGD
jgi:ribosomal protein S27AE